MEEWTTQKSMKIHPRSQLSKSNSPIDRVCFDFGKVDLQHRVEILAHQFQYAHLPASINLLHNIEQANNE